MNVYSLHSLASGADLGLFHADTEEDAYDAMLRDAGYVSREDFARLDIVPKDGESDDEFVARKSRENRAEIDVNELGGSYDLEDDRLSDQDVDLEVSPHAIVVRFGVDGDTQEFREESEDMRPHLERLAAGEHAYVSQCVDSWFAHVRPDELDARVADASSLDRLLDALEARDAFHAAHGDSRRVFDDTNLPTFGREPKSTLDVWSWDDTRCLRHDGGWSIEQLA